MSAEDDELEVVACPECGSEYERGSYCGECGYDQDPVEPGEAAAAAAEPVYARAVEPRALTVFEPAFCPHCIAFLTWFSTKEEARAYEASLENHAFEYCVRRRAALNGSEEWRLRHEAAKWGSLAANAPKRARVAPGDASKDAAGASA